MPLLFHKRNSDAPLIAFLPLDRSAKRGRSGEVSVAVRSLQRREAAFLEKAAQDLGTTTEDLLLACFATLLARLTRQDTVSISIEDNDLIRFNLDDQLSLRGMIRAMHGTEGALNQVVERSTLAIEQPSSSSAERVVRYEFSSKSEVPSAHGQCDLRLFVQGTQLRLELTSPTGLWPDSILENWLGYMAVLTECACAEPDKPVRWLPLWEESEARGFYKKLNRTAVEFTGDQTVPGRFGMQAKRRSQATAVISGARRYTYRELDERSTLLAQQLVAVGAGPDRAVAVCMERSVDLLLVLLAVLKSGSFYVPLEPSNPSERLRGILDECKPVAMVSDRATIAAFHGWMEQNPQPLICVDDLKAETHTSVALPTEIDPENLAYTIYTSGTTGKPKGVRIRHMSLTNLICSVWQTPGLTENDRTLGTAPISFDIATMDMFLPICSGGTLVIASRQESMDPYRLARLIEDHNVTCFQATPATWRLLVTSGWKGKRDLKMLCGGEALPRELADDLLSRGAELWNCYGPTETTIWSGIMRVRSGSGTVPVGPPIANTSFYLLDKGGNLLPPGVPGELCIGGRGVSPGYVARPELTEQRFIPDRFGPDPSAFLFRTGDLVRLINGNEFEFFGRMDDQVKLRGYRIELGEIESVLRRHPSVTDAVVVLREDVPGEPRLVAYIIATDGTEVSAAELGEHAGRLLPEYMLPTLIVRVDHFPLSTAGKINRRALPVPESVPGQIAPRHPAAEDPADELETKLLKIFREVLRNSTLGVTDSFFHYGGYSLLTIRLFSRIDRELQARLPISLLFDAPTVRELARVIRSGIKPSIIVPIRPHGRSAPIFLIQSYLLYNAMLEMVEPDRPVYGVREMGGERTSMTVTEQASQFAREIVAVHPKGPLYLAGWCAAGTLTVEIARQLHEAGHEVGLVALFDAEHPDFMPTGGLGAWMARFGRKIVYHTTRLGALHWAGRRTYIAEAIERNWDWAVELFDTVRLQVMTALRWNSGGALPGTAFYRAQANMTGLDKLKVQSYPGKLNLYRAADVPDRMEEDSTLGWGIVARKGVAVDYVPGDHVSMFKKPNIDHLGDRLQKEMQRCETA